MSAFKQFLSTDVTVVPFVVNKSFSFEGTESFNNNGIERLYGADVVFGSSGDTQFTSNFSQSISSSLIYNSFKQLYYTNYIPNPISGSPYITDFNNNVVEDDSLTNIYSRFYNYEQTSLFQTNSNSTYTSNTNYSYNRYFPFGLSSNVTPGLSIPKSLFGDYINPNTFYFKITTEDGSSYEEIRDDGNGILIQTDGSPTDYLNKSVGIINYSHGTIVFPLGDDVISSYIIGPDSTNNITCSFQSSRTIFETQYKCTIRPDEFNFSLNPSLISGSTDGTVYNFVTSSYFSPYVTTVGLYNEAQELLMVAKLSKPLPTSATTDTTILINIDK
jgi:hypothetical protein